MRGVSVIVCCYNSAARLPQTILHLVQQNVPADIPWEIILVNNASKDNTSQIALQEWNKNPLSKVAFTIVEQPLEGLSHAREKGVATSAYDVLIFCDDDNWLAENYVETAFNLLEEWPTAAIIGGIGTAAPETYPPQWFETYRGYYATGAQNSMKGLLESNEAYVYGAGSVVRKAVLQRLSKINFKPLATDRRNESLSSGGDVELCYAVSLLGYKIGYSDNLKFQHFIPKNRLGDNYLLDLVYQFGYCNILHRPYYWLFNPHISGYKKTWWWALIISLHIYVLSLFKYIFNTGRANKFTAKVNLNHAKGRLVAAISLNYKIMGYYYMLKQKFNNPNPAKI